MVKSSINSQRIWEVSSLAIGLSIYGYFLCHPGIGIFDWAKELAYFTFLKSSLSESWSIPIIWWDKPDLPYPAVRHTGLFIANPETFLFSPWIMLLPLMSAASFIKLLTVIHWIIGVSGIYALAKKQAWSGTQRRVFFSCFILSPIILQHIAIGYTPWLNLFFFPWLILALISERSWKRLIFLSMIIAMVLLQGGSHVGYWYLIMVVGFEVLTAAMSRRFRPLLHGSTLPVVVVLLAAARIVPTAFIFRSFHQSFEPGYQITHFLSWALIPPPIDLLGEQFQFNSSRIDNGVPAWDGAVFWWIVLPLFLYVSLQTVLRWHSLRQNLYHRQLTLLGWVFLCFSFGTLYPTVVNSITSVIDIPFLQSAEKYPYRFAILAYFIASFLIADRLESLSINKYLRLNSFGEILVILPFIVASLYWLNLSLSRAPISYNTSAKPPLIRRMNRAEKDGWLVEKSDSTLKFKRSMISESPAPRDQFLLPELTTFDLPFLEFSSEKATIVPRGGKRGMVLRFGANTDELSVRVSPKLYRWAWFVSLVSWLTALLLAFQPRDFIYRCIQFSAGRPSVER